MAFPIAVNSQITDSVTQANVKVLGDSPAIAMGNLLAAASGQALADAANNAAQSFATMVEWQRTLAAQATFATGIGVATLYSLDTVSDAVATARILASK
ncbi:RebB family R body protein [Azospirillum agricola]|uniref:RebB family R body protein n=1 Tax=Azospirillum agricola TaxID=1720247 RepID=UPI000A0F2086|nr:RebB family R body protein [Azospirillum agricola]SMH58612.1 Killing trait domain-containing protein [Azospirillum lipoferum]